MGEVNRVMPLLAINVRAGKQSFVFLRSGVYPHARLLPRVLLTAEPTSVRIQQSVQMLCGVTKP